MGAKVALISGLAFYIITIFILKVDLHFIHIWGIEFLLNMLIMFIFSYFFKNVKPKMNIKITKQTKWKYSKQLSYTLILRAQSFPGHCKSSFLIPEIKFSGFERNI